MTIINAHPGEHDPVEEARRGRKASRIKAAQAETVRARQSAPAPLPITPPEAVTPTANTEAVLSAAEIAANEAREAVLKAAREADAAAAQAAENERLQAIADAGLKDLINRYNDLEMRRFALEGEIMHTLLKRRGSRVRYNGGSIITQLFGPDWDTQHKPNTLLVESLGQQI